MKVYLLFTGNFINKFKIFAVDLLYVGENGEPGKEGDSGKDVKTEDKLEIDRKDYIGYNIVGGVVCRLIAFVEKKRWRDTLVAPRGKAGNNAEIKGDAEKLPPIKRGKVINAFKKYVRSCWKDGFMFKSQSENWLLQFENNGQITRMYDTSDLLDDFKSIEDQYMSLKNNGYSVLSSLTSLKKRIADYSKYSRNNATNWLYGTVLTKMSVAQSNANQNTVIDLSGFLEGFSSEVAKLKVMRNREIIQANKEKYMNILTGKTLSAQNTIERVVIPEIEMNTRQIEHNIIEFREEIKKEEKKNEQEIGELEKRKKKEREAMNSAQLFSALQMLGSFLSIVSPFAGLLVQTTTAISQTVSKTGVPPIVDTNFKAGVAQVAAKISYEKKLHNDKINEVEKLLKLHATNEPDDHDFQKNVQDIIANAKKQQLNLKDDTLDPALLLKIRTDREKMVTDLTAVKDKLTSAKSGVESKVETKLKCINTMTRVLGAFDSVNMAVTEMVQQREAANKIDQEIEKSQTNLKRLKELEELMLETMVPAFTNLEHVGKSLNKNLQGLRAHELDVKKWQMKQMLNDMKLAFSKLFVGFTVEEQFKQSLDRIAESMEILVDIFNRIESYADSANLAIFFSDVLAPNEFSLGNIEREYAEQIEELQKIIKSSLIFEQYERAIKSYAQVFFPLSNEDLKEFYLPDNNTFANPETMASEIVAAVDKMQNKIIGYEHSLLPIDNDFLVTTSYTFYTWRDEELINKILRGETGVAVADISHIVRIHAVRFRTVEIRFKLDDQSHQTEFDDLLQREFNVRLTMLGNSYYRCGRDITQLSVDLPISIVHSFNRTSYRDYLTINPTGTKILKNPFMLSPYTMWSIRLENGDFGETSKYINSVSEIELYGWGIYLPDQGNHICSN